MVFDSFDSPGTKVNEPFWPGWQQTSVENGWEAKDRHQENPFQRLMWGHQKSLSKGNGVQRLERDQTLQVISPDLPGWVCEVREGERRGRARATGAPGAESWDLREAGDQGATVRPLGCIPIYAHIPVPLEYKLLEGRDRPILFLSHPKESAHYVADVHTDRGVLMSSVFNTVFEMEAARLHREARQAGGVQFLQGRGRWGHKIDAGSGLVLMCRFPEKTRKLGRRGREGYK